MKKRFVSLLSCMLLAMSVATPAAANELPALPKGGIVSPAYVNINYASSSLSISGSGQASVFGHVEATSSATSIYLMSTLQRYNNGTWESVRAWVKSSTDWYALISETYSVTKGEYRLKTYYSVEGAGGTETGTVYSPIAKY